jgi:signal transduction histidine kinase
MSTRLSPLLLHCLGLAAPQAQRAQVILRPPWAEKGMLVQADEALLVQAVERLLHHTLGQQVAGAELTLRATRQGGRACLGVQVLGSRGTRLGGGSPALEAAHQLVQRLGGGLGSSASAHGTRAFHIWLPLASDDPFCPLPASKAPAWSVSSPQAAASR